jgi:hypothetical protein
MEDNSNDSDVPQSGKPSRRSYCAPSLQRFGSLAQITQAGTGMVQENGPPVGQPGGPPFCNDNMGSPQRRPC